MKNPFPPPHLPLAAAIVLWTAPLLRADTPLPPTGDYTFTITADHADAMYHRGDTATFTVHLNKSGAPVEGQEVKWTLSKDGVAPRTQGTAKVEHGTFTVSGKLDEPGFLHCLAECAPPAAPRLVAHGGAAFDPVDIKPSQPCPDDFDAFWAAQKKLLAAVPLNIRLTPVKSPVAGVECFDLQADSVGGPLSGYLARPVGARPKTLPGIVLTHGAGVNSSRIGTAAGWAKDGFVALDFNVHGLPNGQSAKFYTDLRDGRLKDYNVQGRTSRDTVYFREVFLRLLRAIDAVAAQPEWDGRELMACGRSQGGGQAIVAGALDPRITYVSAEVPALCDHTGSTIGRVNGWPRFIASDNAKPDPQIVEAVRYYDCVNFAARIRSEAFLTVGFLDVICPPTSVYAAYNQIKTPKQIWHHLDTGHVGRADYEARVREDILAVLARRKTASRQ